MRRTAGMQEDEIDYEEEEDEEEDEDIIRSAERLQVFCVSAVDYLKMKGLLRDGPPQVMHHSYIYYA